MMDPTPAPAAHPPARRRPTLLLSIAVVGAALAALAVLASWSRPPEDPERSPEPLAVLTAAVERSDGFTVRRRLAGRVEAERHSQVGFELAGTVDAVLVDEGDRVRAGQPLARLDTRLLVAERRRLRAQADRSRADLELAEATLERHRRAIARRAVSPQALSEAQRSRDAAGAALAAAEAAVAAVDVRLEKSRLAAPFDAWVATRAIDEGQVVAAGTPILELLEDAPALARIGIPAEMTAALDAGRRYAVAVDGVTYDATLVSLAPRRQAETRVVEARFGLGVALGERSTVRQGDLATLFLDRTVGADGFRLPLAALTEGSRGLWTAYVVRGAPGEVAPVERRPLEVLQPGPDSVFVRGPLAAGERVVVAGLHRLVPGLEVRIEAAEAAPSSAAGGRAPADGPVGGIGSGAAR